MTADLATTLARWLRTTVDRVARAVALVAVACAAAPADSAPADAAQDPWADACLVRPEAAPPPGQTMSPPAPRQSSLGWRHARLQIFDVALTVVAANAVCSVSGVARLRSGPDGGTLVFPIRSDTAASRNSGASPCLVTLHTTAGAVDIATSEACLAQAVCGARVALQGQRFELASSVAPEAPSACFAQPRSRP